MKSFGALLLAAAFAACSGGPVKSARPPETPADGRAVRTLAPSDLEAYRLLRDYLSESQREAFIFKPDTDSMVRYLRFHPDLGRRLFDEYPGLLVRLPYPFRNKMYVARSQDLLEETRQAILAAEPIPGMTRDEVKAAWGDPALVEEGPQGPEAEIGGVFSQPAWRYDRPEGPRFVLFRRDRVTAVSYTPGRGRPEGSPEGPPEGHPTDGVAGPPGAEEEAVPE